MAINPKLMMQMRERMNIFSSQHPRFGMFLQNLNAEGVEEGTIIELKVTKPDGRTSVTNIKLTAEDVETIRMAQQMR